MVLILVVLILVELVLVVLLCSPPTEIPGREIGLSYSERLARMGCVDTQRGAITSSIHRHTQ